MDGSMGECITRAALNELFPDHPFTKVRPLWLGNLEFDCYNEELRIAVEYQGIQHYEYTPIFHRNGPEDFVAQQVRDNRKRCLAFNQFIVLLEIPYTVRHEDIRAKVYEMILDLRCVVKPTKPTASLDDFIRSVCETQNLPAVQLKKASEIAASHGGKCLSDVYVNAKYGKLVFECKHGHKFVTPLDHVKMAGSKRPRFCPDCGGTRKRTLEETRAEIEPTGYTLLALNVKITGTEGHERNTTYLQVQCPEGHIYDVARDNFLPLVDDKPIKKCMKCERARTNQERAIIERNAKAEEWGLRILTEEFAPRHDSMLWTCNANGHRFTASYHTVLIRKNRKCLLC